MYKLKSESGQFGESVRQFYDIFLIKALANQFASGLTLETYYGTTCPPDNSSPWGSDDRSWGGGSGRCTRWPWGGGWRSHWAPCAQNDKINVLAIGASQFRGNYLPLLQKLLPAHKVVLYSPSPFNKNTHPHPLIFLRGSMHQKSESVRREVI